jgi:2'-5' RNA ligase
MRAFLAIDLPDQTCDALEALQRRLNIGRHTLRENLHLTVAFLGEQQDAVMADVDDALLALEVPRFALSVSGLGTLGAPEPQILFAGVAPCEGLEALHRKVRSSLRGVGLTLPRERFRPHVTLARFAHGLTGPEIERLAAYLGRNAAFSLEPFVVTALSLYRSTLRPSGPVHDLLTRYPLR